MRKNSAFKVVLVRSYIGLMTGSSVRCGRCNLSSSTGINHLIGPIEWTRHWKLKRRLSEKGCRMSHTVL